MQLAFAKNQSSAICISSTNQIKIKLFAGLLLNLLLLATIEIISLGSIGNIHDKINTLASDPIPATAKINEATRYFLLTVTKLNTYVATGVIEEKNAYLSSAEQFDKAIGELKDLSKSFEPEAAQNSSILIYEISNHWLSFQNTATSYLNIYEKTKTADPEMARQIIGHINSILPPLNEFIAQENEEIRSAYKSADATTTNATVTISILMGAVLIILLILNQLIIRGVIKPLYELEKIAKSVSRGDFKQKLKTKTKDEMGAVSETFNVMMDSMEKSQTEMSATAKKRTAEIQQKMAELEKINSLMIERENKMATLKKEMENLKKNHKI
jgi:HAMP domain-containing protein